MKNFMNDINWYCKLIGIRLSLYQKLLLKIRCGKAIHNVRNSAKYVSYLNTKIYSKKSYGMKPKITIYDEVHKYEG